MTPCKSFRAPSKGALPPGSPCRAPTEGDTPLLELHFICFSESPVNEPTSRSPVEMPVSRAFFYTSLAAPPKKDLLVNQKSKSHLSHKVPGIGTPSMITQQGPYGERHSVFRANGSFIHISQSTHLRSSPKKQTGDIWSPPMQPYVEGRHTYNEVRPGSQGDCLQHCNYYPSAIMQPAAQYLLPCLG